MQNKITYLSRQISSEQILPDESGVTAVRNLKALKDIEQLEAFKRKVSYYHIFIPNLRVRRGDVPFRKWRDQQKCFDDLKSYIANAT